MHVEVDLFCLKGFESYYKLTQEKNDWHTAISRKVVGKNVHVTIPKVIWDIINTPFLTLQLSNLHLLLSFSSSQTYVHSLLYYSFKFLWRTVYSKPPTIPFGIVTCTFSDNLSRNGCMLCRELYEILLTVLMVNCHNVTCWIFDWWISC